MRDDIDNLIKEMNQCWDRDKLVIQFILIMREIPTDELNEIIIQGDPLLIYFHRRDRPAVVQRLLDLGADPNREYKDIMVIYNKYYVNMSYTNFVERESFTSYIEHHKSYFAGEYTESRVSPIQTSILEAKLKELIKTNPTPDSTIDNILMPWLIEVIVEYCDEIQPEEHEIFEKHVECMYNLIYKYVKQFNPPINQLQEFGCAAFVLSAKNLELDDIMGCHLNEINLIDAMVYMANGEATKPQILKIEREMFGMTDYMPCGNLLNK